MNTAPIRAFLRTLWTPTLQALAPALAITLVIGATAGAVTVVSLASSVEVDGPAGPTGDDAEDTSENGTTDLPADSTDSGEDDGGTDVTVVDGNGGQDDAISDEGGDEGGRDEVAELTFEEAVAKHGRPDYAHILTRRYPGALWSLNGSSYAGLTWLDDAPKPTQAELDALWPGVAAELAAERAEQEAAEAAAAAARAAQLEARRNDPGVQALLDSCDPRTIWGSPDYAHILTRRFPGAQWSLNGNDPANGLVWHSAGTAPTKAQLDAMWADVAREMALEMDPKELERWCGVGDQIYVDGVLRPKGWVGGKDDPQPDPPAITRDNCRYMPMLPNDGGGRTIDVWKDPTGAKNFDMVIGISYEELGYRISEAHGFWGGQYCLLGIGVNGDRTFTWYSSQADDAIILGILTSLGALPANTPEPAPEPEPAPSDDSTDDGAQAPTDDGADDGAGDGAGEDPGEADEADEADDTDDTDEADDGEADDTDETDEADDGEPSDD